MKLVAGFVSSRRWLAGGVATAVLSTGLTASASTIYLVDFSADVAGSGPGGTWNTFAAPGNVNGGTISTSTGAPSAVTLLLQGTATDNSQAANVVFNNNQAGYEGTPSWATSTTENAASGDFFYTANSATSVPHTYTVTWGGLTAGDKVSLDLLSSRDSANSKGYFDYSLDNGGTWTGFRVLNADGSVATTNGWNTNDTKSQVFVAQTEGFNVHRYMNVNDVTLTGSTFLVRVTDADAVTATFSNINAMRLTVVPEPASLGLGALLVGGLLSRRRRR